MTRIIKSDERKKLDVSLMVVGVLVLLAVGAVYNRSTPLIVIASIFIILYLPVFWRSLRNHLKSLKGNLSKPESEE